MDIEVLATTLAPGLAPGLAELLSADARLEQMATGFVFTEGPLWHPDEGALYFSDIPANRIYRWRPGTRAVVYREPSGKSNGLTWDREGGLLACEHMGRRVSRTLAHGVAHLAATYEGKRLSSPNDVICKSDGTVYFTDPPYGILSAEQGALADQEQPVNGLYLVRPGSTEPVLLAGDFERPNGLAFSPDESLLYVNDTPRYHTRVFDVAPDGTLSNSRIFAEYPAEKGVGRPDGMKVTTCGHVITTGPGGLWIVSPLGEVLGHVPLPEKGTNCAWGDADLKGLYITAGQSVYRLRFEVRGIGAFPAA